MARRLSGGRLGAGSRFSLHYACSKVPGGTGRCADPEWMRSVSTLTCTSFAGAQVNSHRLGGCHHGHQRYLVFDIVLPERHSAARETSRKQHHFVLNKASRAKCIPVCSGRFRPSIVSLSDTGLTNTSAKWPATGSVLKAGNFWKVRPISAAFDENNQAKFDAQSSPSTKQWERSSSVLPWRVLLIACLR